MTSKQQRFTLGNSHHAREIPHHDESKQNLLWSLYYSFSLGGVDKFWHRSVIKNFRVSQNVCESWNDITREWCLIVKSATVFPFTFQIKSKKKEKKTNIVLHCAWFYIVLHCYFKASKRAWSLLLKYSIVHREQISIKL